MLPATANDIAVTTLAATAAQPAVAIDPVTAILPTVAIDPATPALATVAADPATPVLATVATDPTADDLPHVSGPLAGSRTTLGVARETIPGERRVALIPKAIPGLLGLGANVVVESGAGEGALLAGLHARRESARLPKDATDRPDD